MYDSKDEYLKAIDERLDRLEKLQKEVHARFKKFNKNMQHAFNLEKREYREDCFTLQAKLYTLKHQTTNKKIKKIFDQILLTDDGTKLVRYEQEEPGDWNE